MCTVAATAAWRAVLLPALYAAWSRADLVAGRPVERLREAERLDAYEQALTLALLFGFAAIAWIGLRAGSVAGTKPVAVRPPDTMSAAGTITVAAPAVSPAP
jgi:hypothetical protein